MLLSSVNHQRFLFSLIELMNAHPDYLKAIPALLALILLAGCAGDQAEEAVEQAPNLEVSREVASAGLSEPVDFNQHVRPILSDNCYACHGPDVDNQESAFRLDSQEASRMNLAGEGEAPRHGIVPGKPDASLILARILHEDPSMRMPPPAKKKELTSKQVATLRQWILDGAKYEKHWAFVPPAKPELPAVKRADWVRNAIDTFVLAKLESKGIQPSPEADRSTLVRRVYLDLVGLPPNLEEMNAFLEDGSESAYEKMVDRALASPHYGERLAIDWLDAARYGDSNAIHVDMMRTSWPWRDWVIRAFNSNMPYDQFLIEQLAGDLLPNATDQQKVATAFNRNHGITNEGGVIPEEFLVEYAVDRVSTMGAATMGLTLGCARCHDHKFDPITQDDFFSLTAFFNNIPEKGLEQQNEFRALAYPPFIYVYTDEEKELRVAADKALQEAARLKGLKEKPKEHLPGDDKVVTWEALTLVKAHSDKKKVPSVAIAANNKEAKQKGKNAILQLEDSKQVRFQLDIGADAALTLNFKAPTAAFNTIRVEAALAVAKPGNKNFSPGDQDSVIAEIEAELHTSTATQAVDIVTGSSSFAAREGNVDAALDKAAASVWNLGMPEFNHHFFLQLKEPITPEQGELAIRFRYRGGQPMQKFYNDLTFYTGNNPHGLDEPIALIPAADRSEWHREALLIGGFKKAGKTTLTAAELTRARADDAYLQKTATRCMVMEEKETVAPTYVLDRGLYNRPLKDRPRERVTPAVFEPMPADAPTNRLGLAQWLVSDTHPLAARFAVNRFWQQLFQHGIVRTSDDFGLQGESPTHPALLNYLAVDFRENGWDVKRLIKQMVMSATYRQSSRRRKDLKSVDPENRWLAVAPRYRLSAEVIRDNALAASGLLNDAIGGPSVKPYQPAGLWREKTMRPNSNTGVFRRDTGEKLYRRGMYTFWKQASPPPQMELFDAPSREACVMKRRKTNTPLQALMLMNDETYLEISRELATRLFNEVQGDWEEQLTARIERGLLLGTGRKPASGELDRWVAFTRDTHKRFADSPDDAADFLSYGEKPRDTNIPQVELAALAFSMSTVLNLDETITRD